LSQEEVYQCAFCNSLTNLPIACDTCWDDIVIANVSNGTVFGAGETEVTEEEIIEVRKI